MAQGRLVHLRASDKKILKSFMAVFMERMCFTNVGDTMDFSQIYSFF